MMTYEQIENLIQTDENSVWKKISAFADTSREIFSWIYIADSGENPRGPRWGPS